MLHLNAIMASPHCGKSQEAYVDIYVNILCRHMSSHMSSYMCIHGDIKHYGDIYGHIYEDICPRRLLSSLNICPHMSTSFYRHMSTYVYRHMPTYVYRHMPSYVCWAYAHICLCVKLYVALGQILDYNCNKVFWDLIDELSAGMGVETTLRICPLRKS